jgi:hypothetical protein
MSASTFAESNLGRKSIAAPESMVTLLATNSPWV